MGNWRDKLAPGISIISVPDDEILDRIIKRMEWLESEFLRLSILSGECDPPQGYDADQSKLLVGPLPVHLNLSSYPDPNSVIGWAHCWKTPVGKTRIVVELDTEASEKLTDLAEVFSLRALGFAGIKRKAVN